MTTWKQKDDFCPVISIFQTDSSLQHCFPIICSHRERSFPIHHKHPIILLLVDCDWYDMHYHPFLLIIWCDSIAMHQAMHFPPLHDPDDYRYPIPLQIFRWWINLCLYQPQPFLFRIWLQHCQLFFRLILLKKLICTNKVFQYSIN